MSNIKLEVKKLSNGDIIIKLTTKVVYAMVQTPQPTFDRTGFENQVGAIVDANTYEQLEELGVNRKRHKHDLGKFIKFKKPAEKDKSSVIVVDKDGNKIKDIVGDGSLCVVGLQISTFGDFKKTNLLGLRVLDLVKYGKKNNDNNNNNSEKEALAEFLGDDLI